MTRHSASDEVGISGSWFPFSKCHGISPSFGAVVLKRLAKCVPTGEIVIFPIGKSVRQRDCNRWTFLNGSKAELFFWFIKILIFNDLQSACIVWRVPQTASIQENGGENSQLIWSTIRPSPRYLWRTTLRCFLTFFWLCLWLVIVVSGTWL